MKDESDELSEESRKKHITYYKSLTKVIEDINKEIEEETEQGVINHLQERIKAINLDKERIEKMFPDIIKEIQDE